MSTATNKDLKLKINILSRTYKEYSGYQKEEVKQRERIQKLVDSGAEEPSIRKQQEVLQETLDIYENVELRIVNAKDALNEFLNENKEHSEMDEELLEQANQLVQQIDQFLANKNSQA